ncbi:MAG: glycosyl transferase [Chlorobi bacterium]|jgi:lipopolysaccharide/colanic/teichoic acid biosynthesis glycosyltransferase|nr:glycosyl transferase [Chlorobiota bacterium]
MSSISISETDVSAERAEQQLLSIELPLGYLFVRRMIELVVVIATLPVTAPLCLLIALIVRIDSPGPVLFWQQRPGRNGELFWMVKFRSMKVSPYEIRQLTAERDHRVTRFGKFIRLSHLDELPQLWNVMRGEMSLIGPRPEPAIFSEVFEENIPLYQYRRVIAPGITGWSQVNQGYTADIESTRLKLEYDLYYILNLSPWLDLQIFFKTIYSMVTGQNAR